MRKGSNVTDLPGVAVVDACPHEMLLVSDYLETFGGFNHCRTGEWVHETPRLQGNVGPNQLTSEELATDNERRSVLETGKSTEKLIVSGPMSDWLRKLGSIQEDVEEEVVGCVAPEDIDR